MKEIIILHALTIIDKGKISISESLNHIPTCDVSIINQVCRTVDGFFKDKAFEGCRTPAPFRNDKAIYKQHKRQRKHK